MTITQVPDDNPQHVQDFFSVPVEDEQEETFDQFAATMPETAQGFLDGPANTESSQTTAKEGEGGFLGDATSEPSLTPERKRVNVTKKVRKAMNKFKTKVADVPILWFHQQAKNNPEWELDKDEQDLLKDSIDTVFDVLDIEVEIQPLSWTLTSVWWVISYPLLAFAFLFLTKKSLTIDREQGELTSE